MNKLLQAAGGRKFLLTLIVIGIALGLELTIGLSIVLGTFLAGALTAFCAANLIVTSRHMTTDVEKRKGGGGAAEAKIVELIEALTNAGEDEYYRDQLDGINAALVQIAQTSQNTFTTVSSTDGMIKKALTPKQGV